MLLSWKQKQGMRLNEKLKRPYIYVAQIYICVAMCVAMCSYQIPLPDIATPFKRPFLQPCTSKLSDFLVLHCIYILSLLRFIIGKTLREDF